MAAWVAEYSGFAAPPPRFAGQAVPAAPALAVTQLSSGGSSGTPQTITFTTRTNLVVISPTSNFFASFGSSVFSSTAGSTISSTGSEFFMPNITHMRGVAPSSKMLCFST